MSGLKNVSPLFVNAAPPAAPRTVRAATLPLKVFKFGGSVLRHSDDLARVAGEIYRESRFQERVIAVVSALEGETDELLAACHAIAGHTQCAGTADAVSLGEEKAAALLRIACDRMGLETRVARPEQFGIATRGDRLEAEPVGIRGSLDLAFGTARVLIVPGFVGIAEDGSRTLLGRGGTDFTAIYLGGELEADVIRLYKDVDGVFDHDPALGGEDLHRFDQVGWEDCLTLARPLLQPRAVEYARRKRVALEVGSIGSVRPTRVGAASVKPTSVQPPRRTRIALAGYGTVGQALARRLEREPAFEVVSILARDDAKRRTVLPPVPITCDPRAFQQADHDVLVDATSCHAMGLNLSILGLANAKGVISANKIVVGHHLFELEETAAQRGGRLFYSATVGGSTPMLETVRLACSRGDVLSIRAILNGTVNFLLDAAWHGASFAQGLVAAREAGFAEADPSLDLSGKDAELKLRILAAQIAGPSAPVEMHVQGLWDDAIDRIGEASERWIQLSSLDWIGGTIIGSVRIRPAAELEGLPPPAGERNLIWVETANGERFDAFGRGAGGPATAEALLADLHDFHRQRMLEANSAAA